VHFLIRQNVIEATSDVALTVKYRGSDGITRTIIFPLE